MEAVKVYVAVTIFALLAASSMAADLPISRVVLFSSGVGYFERAGSVQGNATVELKFRVDQINDILKSMTVEDFGGGQVGAVTYAPQDPLSRTLESFAVNVQGNPSLSELLQSLTGAKVNIVTQDGTVSGVVVSVEEQEKSSGDDVVTFQVVNILADSGLVQVPIWHMKSVKLADDKLATDLQKALAAISAARNTDKRSVNVAFHGEGSRKVRLGYLLETPVWKTSYRLMAGEDKLFLQGWGIVENTTDDDWANVRLSMVSGQPISFIQNLYEPLYVERPVVQPQIAASPKPQMYGGAMEEMAADAMAAPAPAMSPAMSKADSRMMMRGAGGYAGTMAAEAQPLNLADSGVAAAAQGAKVGELFQYAIEQPISINRQQSAMIPIINQGIGGRKVSIYNAGVNNVHPLNGLQLVNDTKLHLMGGPITVFDGGVYAGDALIGDVPPGDKRLLSYAVDLGVRVDSKSKTTGDKQSTSAKLVHGLLTVTVKQTSEQTYTFKNVSQSKRTIIVEHPLRGGWKLIAPEKPMERTDNLYRFEVTVEPGKSAELVVKEEQPVSERMWLSDLDTNDLQAYVSTTELSQPIRDAMSKVMDMKTGIEATKKQISEREARLKEIGEEQDRIRKNMEQLERNSDLYTSYVAKFTAQETEFEKLQGEIKQLNGDLTTKETALKSYIEGLDLS